MFHHRVSLYVSCLLVTALLLGSGNSAEAKIQYTDITDTAVWSENNNLEIKFLAEEERQFNMKYDFYDNDDHFTIVTNTESSYSPWVAGGFYATAYDFDDDIPGDLSGGGGTKNLVVVHNDDPIGDWENGSLYYLGVSFKLDSQTHYGWIAAQYDRNANKLFISGYAYETEVDTPIKAGATPEPTTLTLLGFGALALRRRKRN
ncbi:MAG: PEP-CTERM sorting domain-containing protein [Phycisphaerae bacterium]|nr:PEP-CTERM sorting domain-containing protein [Phycisphaerae bacterium]